MTASRPGNPVTAEWTSPSNIALVKYWGKHGNQLPGNPSLSMTLKNSFSRTRVSASPAAAEPEINFFFEGMPAPEFEPKIQKFLKNVSGHLPFLKHSDLTIESLNTFPHSSGIASSASAMSALALCLCDISGDIDPLNREGAGFFRKASEISRLGSGSASRSVYGGFCVWGKTGLVERSSDNWAVPVDSSIHRDFKGLQDSILIVSAARKNVSSSEGHGLMNGHPYARQRYALAEKNLEVLLHALKSGNVKDFIRITENEALGLHGLMMSSDPGFTLIEPGTLKIISEVRKYRERTGKFICFTLDAGPNVHLIYPGYEKEEIRQFVVEDLKQHCEEGKVLWDECGTGPARIS